MKPNIHPEYREVAFLDVSVNKTFIISSAVQTKETIEIDGKTYNFGNDGYLTYGIQVLRDSTSFKKYVFDFGDNGVLVREIKEPGLFNAHDGIYYIN